MVNVGTKPAEEDEGEDMIAAEGGRACDGEGKDGGEGERIELPGDEDEADEEAPRCPFFFFLFLSNWEG